MQKAQQEMLQVQQEFINDLKKMIALLLEKSKKKPKSLRPSTSSSKRKGKEKIGGIFTSKNTGNENNFDYENLKSSFEDQENLEKLK